MSDQSQDRSANPQFPWTSVLSVVVSVGALSVGVVSLIFAAKANDHAAKANQLIEKAYAREEQYAAVIDTSSVGEFSPPITQCRAITVTYWNRSKFATAVRLVVKAEGLCVHHEQGDTHPALGIAEINFDSLIVPPEQKYEARFRIHTLVSHPKDAKVSLWMNGKLDREFRYSLVSGQKEYALVK